MKSVITGSLIFLILLLFPDVILAKEIYTDVLTGKTVWRMTNSSVEDWTLYYHHYTMSPNGKYLIFGTQRSPYIYFMNADGSGEKSVGDSSTWNSYNVNFSGNILHGWWSSDGKYYYVFDKLCVVDMDKFVGGQIPANYISQISSARAANFYYPMLSPDGKRLVGLANKEDTSSGTIVKMINIDGTNYAEFVPNYSNVDVTHGWVGNDAVWINERSNDVPIVYSRTSQNEIGKLSVSGAAFDHVILSSSGYYIGGKEGTIGGRGRYFANTDWTSQDPVIRNLKTIPWGNGGEHNSFSPDGKWTLTADFYSSDPDVEGLVMVYPLPSNTETTQPVKVARFRRTTDTGYFVYASWSPDGTKIPYYTDYLNVGNVDDNGIFPNGVGIEDVYMAIFENPDTPTSLKAVSSGNNVDLTWKPAFSHREIKEYEIQWSQTQNGSYQSLATIPAKITFLNNSGKINTSDTTINVDSTSGFTAPYTIEVFGLSAERPTEVMSCSGITTTSFTGCTRGAFGTIPAEHYNDAFVWAYTGANGYKDNGVSGSRWYKIRSVEWSGLTSNFSAPVTFSSGTFTPTPTGIIKPGDANGDGKVDDLDYTIWANNYGLTNATGPRQGDFNNDHRVDDLDYTIWANNYGK